MLKLFKRRERTTIVEFDRSELQIRDLLEHPQLRAAMGLPPLPGTAATTAPAAAAAAASTKAVRKAPARAHRRRRVAAPTATARPAQRPLIRSAA